jgi:16S rRNA (adenine1518-N6/adenine1519-N6)-dimethyltransferase
MAEAPVALPFARSPIIAFAKVPVREILDRYGISPRKRFGQNFLHDPAVAARIVEVSGVRPGDAVLEIGPGLGALTVPLLERGARVVAVEVDRRICAYLRDELAGRPGFVLLEANALDVDPGTIAGAGTLLVANLPYAITGPVLARLIEHADVLDRAVVMVQREVAKRLTAGAGGKEIGAPSVLLRLLYRVERLFDVGSGAFLPPPEVASSVLRLDRIHGARVDPAVRTAVNRAYRNRRKMLRKTLGGVVAEEESVARALTELGRPDTARPEDLEPEEWPRLLEIARGGAA